MSYALRTALMGLALVVAISPAACQRVRPPVEPREDTAGWPQIMLADRDLQRRIAVRQPQVSQDRAGLLFVTVPVRNTTAQQFTMEYRVTFFDRNHAPIQQTTWFPKTMPPHTQETITVNSTSPRADDFQIDLRPAK
jgi:uncharacterized protein DUF1425